MIISKPTITLLKNFSQINQSINVNPGNVIETISPALSTMGLSTVTETFEVPFAINDLNKFLSVLSLFNEPEIKFNERNCIISDSTNKKSRVTYRYCHPDTITYPKKRLPDLPEDIMFELSEENFKKLLKAAGILHAPNIAFVGDGENISVVAYNAIDSGSDSFKLNLVESDKKFKTCLKTENLKFISSPYEIRIISKMVQFISDNVVYWVACELND